MRKLLNIKLFKDKNIVNEYKNIKALYNNNAYIFMLDDVKTYISNNEFTRENNEFKFTLNIQEKTSTYLLKDQNMLFDIDVLKISSKISDNNIILEYKLSSDDSDFKIEIIIEGEINE